VQPGRNPIYLEQQRNKGFRLIYDLREFWTGFTGWTGSVMRETRTPLALGAGLLAQTLLD
jgi:hypothetical protein